MDSLVRLNKFIASNGISSRRKVDEMIEQGRVTINGHTIKELGFKINPDKDKVALDGEQIKTDTKKIYIILNKPKGIITSVSDERHRPTVIDLIKIHQKIFPVGRLDYNTSGLLLLTNDGDLANKLMSPKSKVYKTYFVQLSKPLEEKHRIKLSEGIKLEGQLTAPAIIKFPRKTDYQSLYISIYEGKNHQVRNMFEHYGYFVRELQRIEYAGLKLGSLREGEWSYLTAEELAVLNSTVKDTPANYPKPERAGKKQFRKDFKKYKSYDDRKDVKRSFKKFDKRDGKKEKKLSFNKKHDEERGVELGFKKNVDIDVKKDFKTNNKNVKRGFKKYKKHDDKKYEKGDFKKFEGRDDKKDTKQGFKKYKKRDDKKYVKGDFKESEGRHDKKDTKQGFKKYKKRDDKKYIKGDFKKFEGRDKKYKKRDDKKYAKGDFKK